MGEMFDFLFESSQWAAFDLIMSGFREIVLHQKLKFVLVSVFPSSRVVRISSIRPLSELGPARSRHGLKMR